MGRTKPSESAKKRIPTRATPENVAEGKSRVLRRCLIALALYPQHAELCRDISAIFSHEADLAAEVSSCGSS